MPLDQSAKDDMIASYLAGERVAPLAARHGVPRSTLYAVLRAAGIEPGRVPKSTPLSPRHYCGVCGGPKPPPSSGHRSGEWWEALTCGDPACVSLSFLVPRTRKRRAREHGHHKTTAFVMGADLEYDEETREYTEELAFDDVLERDFDEVEDERIADVSAEAKAFAWSPVSASLVAVQVPPGVPGGIGLELHRPTAQAFLDEFCGGSPPPVLDNFDLIYVWRCDCPQQSTFEVVSLGDLPDLPGFYGACPRCGSVALRVVE